MGGAHGEPMHTPCTWLPSSLLPIYFHLSPLNCCLSSSIISFFLPALYLLPLFYSISENSVVTTNSLATHTKSFSPDLTDSTMDDSPLSSSPQPPPVSPLTSPPPIPPPTVVAIVTSVQEPIKPAAPIEAPPTTTPQVPVDNNKPDQSAPTTYR